jgi:hypothetical protein
MGAASFNIVQEEINIEHMVEVFVEAANYLMLPTDSHS